MRIEATRLRRTLFRRIFITGAGLVFVAGLAFCGQGAESEDSLTASVLALIAPEGDAGGAEGFQSETVFDDNSGKILIAVLYNGDNLTGSSFPIWITSGLSTGGADFPTNWRNKVRSMIVRGGTTITLWPNLGQSGTVGYKFRAPDDEALEWASIDPFIQGGKSYSFNSSNNRNALALVYSGDNYTGSILPVWRDAPEDLTLAGMGNWKTKVSSIVVNNTLASGQAAEIELVLSVPDERRIVFENIPNLNADTVSQIFSYVGPPPRACAPVSTCHLRPVDGTYNDILAANRCASRRTQATNGPTACNNIQGLSYCTQNGRCINPATNAPIPPDTGRRLSFVDAYVERLPTSSAPTPPTGWGVRCFIGPNSLQSIATCDTLVHKGLRYWAFSHNDNRTAFLIAAYNSSNQLVASQQYNGARYSWRISIDSDDRLAYFLGQAENEVAVSIDSLPGQPAVAKISRYTDANYAGTRYQEGPGEYPVFTVSNDVISSMRIPAGLRVTLYEHTNYRGESRTYTSDINWLGTFNDKASSMIITD